MRPDEQVIFDELCSELLRGRKGVLAMIGQMYLDDSKDGHQKIAVVSAGLLGTREQWSLLWRLWDERLRLDELAYFKTTDCRHLNGAFRSFRRLGKISVGKTAAQKVRSDLERLIRGTGLKALGVAIAMPDWNSLKHLPGSCGFFARDAYETAMQSLFFEGIKRIRRGHNVIAFYHDEGNDFPRLHAVYKDFKTKNERLVKYLAGFDPRDDKQTPPLQAADLIANMALELASEWVQKRQIADLKKLRECIPEVLVWDRVELLRFYERHRHKKELRSK
ncbi:MAG TPA: DUF3800 domain-containing protein [Candidatus Sulfotelmatobacter sp.]